MPDASPSVILLDIEGTVAPISFVHDVLFPYARARMDGFMREHWTDPRVADARVMLDPQSEAFSEASLAALMKTIFDLMDQDAKSTGLKQLQGMIWDRAYRAGAFQSPVYPDVPVALRRWTSAGKTVAIYSSGSVAAQKVFFQHTVAGDLTPLLSAYFDTTTGPKRSAESYASIAAALKCPPARVLFISDVLDEVSAASAAGMDVTITIRPGNAAIPAGPFRRVTTFDGV